MKKIALFLTIIIIIAGCSPNSTSKTSSNKINTTKENHINYSEPFMLTDVLMLKIIKSYGVTCAYNFTENDTIPYNEIFAYFTYEPCYTFDETSLSDEMLKYYNHSTMSFSVPHKIADEFLSKKFNTKADPKLIDCYNDKNGCYEFHRNFGEFYYDVRILKKTQIEDNIFEFTAQLSNDFESLTNHYKVKLFSGGFKLLSIKTVKTGDGSIGKTGDGSMS